MFKKCRNRNLSPFECEKLFPSNLLEHVPLRNDILLAHVFGAGIGPGLPHRSTPPSSLQWHCQEN